MSLIVIYIYEYTYDYDNKVTNNILATCIAPLKLIPVSIAT